MALENLLFMQRRSIAGYIPNVVVEERHTDELQITEHPVERGANISDHAYKLPPEIQMEMMWEQAIGGYIGALGEAFGVVSDPSQILNYTQNPHDIYEAMLKIQRERLLFTVVSGKRVYYDMLMRSITVTTNPDTENVISMVCRMQNVIIVDTKTRIIEGVAPDAVPMNGNSKTRTGTRQARPVDDEQVRNAIGYHGVPNG